MNFVTVKVACRVHVGNEYPFRVTLAETNDGKPLAICDVCDVSDNSAACHDCWKHVRDILESADTIVVSGMHIK